MVERMTNNPQPQDGPLVRQVPVDGIRTISEINDAVEAADQARRDQTKAELEFYSFDGLLVVPLACYVIAFPGGSVLAYLLWPLATLFWTPWLIYRVDSSKPPGDTARAAAFLGYALLGWPLSAVIIELVPRVWEFVLGFPVVFLWSVGFAAKGVWPGRKPQASRRRAWMLTGGVAAYLACSLALVGVVVGGWLGLYHHPALGGTAPLVVGSILAGAVFAALPGLFLLPTALATWRKAIAA